MRSTLNAKSIRPFIGSKNYNLSREFYLDLGFEEFIISENMSSFRTGAFVFYLQDYYAKDWIENSMVFLEVDSPKQLLEDLKLLELPKKYENVKLSEIRHNEWGNEFFLHDPAGILWHFGAFNS